MKIDEFGMPVTGGEGGSGGADVSGVTATAADVASDKKFVTADGTLTDGTLATVTEPAPTLSLNSSTGVVTASYTPVAGQVKDTAAKSGTLQLTTQGATTVTPGSSAQVIPAGKFLTGDITVAAVTPSGGGNTVLSMALAGNFNVTGSLQYALMYPYTVNAEAGDMGDPPDAWAGNFVSDTVNNASTQVLEWPDQDSVEEPWDFNNYWLQIPLDIYNFLNTETEWTIELWWCPGNTWNTGGQAVVIGSERYGGSLFRFEYSPGFGVRLTVCDTSTNRTQVTAGTWYHLAATRKNGVVTFWINGTAAGNFNMPSMPSSSTYGNDYLFCGYAGSGDYRRMKMSQIKISTEALYGNV